jgi:hypothetical protein
LVSPVRQKPKETDKEMGKTLTTERRTKSPLEIKLSIEQSSNHHGEDLGAESSVRESDLELETIFEREGHRSVLRTGSTGLTSWRNRSDRSSLTDRQVVHYLSRKHLMKNR